MLRQLGLPQGAVCLIAVSGGGDSVALLDLASGIAESYPLKLYAAKVVHGIRTPAEEESEITLCRQLCGERGIPFVPLLPGVKTITDIESEYGCGPEQAAREFRRQLLDSHMKSVNADYILFGHTADDRLETIFMRLLSGSGPEGLMGINPVKNHALRPLIGTSRSELREYLVLKGIPWAEDISNDENIYRRNRIRNELIPLISDIIPGWEKALDTLGERSSEASAVLKRTASEQLRVTITVNCWKWKVKDWDSADEYSKALSLWDAFNHLESSDIPDRRLSWRSLKEARSSVNEGRAWRAFNLNLERQGAYVCMSRETAEYKFNGRVILDRHDVENGFNVLFGDVRIYASIQETPDWQLLKLGPGDWPIELKFVSGKAEPEIKPLPITEKSSVDASADADKELVYIFIVYEQEGSNA